VSRQQAAPVKSREFVRRTTPTLLFKQLLAIFVKKRFALEIVSGNDVSRITMICFKIAAKSGSKNF
jgi:hypothetical protein